MRILVVGAGVIGSVYAGRLLEAGHSVTLCARGPRLAELRERGLVLEDASTRRRVHYEVTAVATPDSSMPCDVVLVAVRRDQMVSTLPLLACVQAEVVFFGNAVGLTTQLANRMGQRTLFRVSGRRGSQGRRDRAFRPDPAAEDDVGRPHSAAFTASQGLGHSFAVCRISHDDQPRCRSVAHGARRVHRADRVRVVPRRCPAPTGSPPTMPS